MAKYLIALLALAAVYAADGECNVYLFCLRTTLVFVPMCGERNKYRVYYLTHKSKECGCVCVHVYTLVEIYMHLYEGA